MFDRDTIRKWIKRCGLFLVLSLAATGSHGQDNPGVKQLNALGSAVVHKKNLANSRQIAVENALVNALGQVVMEMLTGETVARRFKLINDSILAQRDNYVQNYRVLTESVSKGRIRTLVQINIATDRVNRDLTNLGLALSGASVPRILFMMAEKNVADADYAYWWGNVGVQGRLNGEAAMAEALQTIGFEVIDLPELNAPLGLPVETSQAQMMALANRLGADVVIAGSGVAAAASNTMGGTIQAFEAIVEAQAFDVQTDRPVGRTRQKAVVSGRDGIMAGRQALTEAGQKAGDGLARQVMTAWRQDQDRSAVIEVAVEGTGGHIASFVRLRTTIASLSGVRELKMNTMSTDQAIMAVNYQGSTRSLADALLLKTFNGFGIDIFEVTPEAVNIRLVHQ